MCKLHFAASKYEKHHMTKSCQVVFAISISSYAIGGIFCVYLPKALILMFVWKDLNLVAKDLSSVEHRFAT